MQTGVILTLYCPNYSFWCFCGCVSCVELFKIINFFLSKMKKGHANYISTNICIAEKGLNEESSGKIDGHGSKIYCPRGCFNRWSWKAHRAISSLDWFGVLQFVRLARPNTRAFGRGNLYKDLKWIDWNDDLIAWPRKGRQIVSLVKFCLKFIESLSISYRYFDQILRDWFVKPLPWIKGKYFWSIFGFNQTYS